jgi:putative DNA primase/helicase
MTMAAVSQTIDVARWTTDWRVRLAAAVASGGGLDLYRDWLTASAQVTDGVQRAHARAEIWDAAVAHLGDEVGLATLGAIYTAVTTEAPPGTPEELDQAALRDEHRRDAGAEVARLARLEPLAYEQLRHEVAERLGVRASVLDAAVKTARQVDGDTRGQGRPLQLAVIEPWHEPVDGAGLLDAIAAFINRFMVLPPGAVEAVALWSVGTHSFQFFEIFPRLTLRSATPQCGKTTLRSIVAGLVPKPLRADSIMPAAVFRTIELERPTLLLDEAETYLTNNEELRGVINSGHRSDGQVIRCVGDDHEPRQFSTWAPMLLAQIGSPPPTVYDRSIVITLTRKKTSEAVEALSDADRLLLRELAQKAARWSADNAKSIATMRPSALPAVSDRANDNWRPLFAVAEVAGGDWPERARTAACLLADRVGHDAASVGEMLIADIHEIFTSRRAGSADHVGRLASVELTGRLVQLEGRPWAEWKAGKPLSPNALARQLKMFKIQPATMRLDDGSILKGYRYRTSRVSSRAMGCAQPLHRYKAITTGLLTIFKPLHPQWL